MESHLHVDLFKTRNEVTDFSKSKASHPRRSSDAHQKHPFLFSVLELLLSKVDLVTKRKEVKIWWQQMSLEGFNQRHTDESYNYKWPRPFGAAGQEGQMHTG